MTEYIQRMVTSVRIQDIIDIAIVAVIIHALIKVIRGTRAEQLSKGIIILLILTKLSEWLEIYTVNYLLSNLMTFGFLAILIVFQPELRRGLELLGRTSSFKNNIRPAKNASEEAIDEMVEAIGSLSRQKIGALIILERATGLSEFVDTGTLIDGSVSSSLLINIFIPNTPLHDGAVIIKNNRIVAAACFLPLTENNNLSRELGTRHRAALGISERSDCLSLVVSEETGSISIAENGKISRHLDLSTLKEILLDQYATETQSSFDLFWKKLFGGENRDEKGEK